MKITNINQMSIIENVVKMKLEQFDAIELTITKFNDDIAQKQRALYKIWCKSFAEHFGAEEEQVDSMFKEAFLLKIYVDNNVDGYKEKGEIINKMKAERHEAYAYFRQDAIERLSVSKRASEKGFKTNLMALYMDKCKIHAATEYGFNMPVLEYQDIDSWNNKKVKNEN